MIKNGSSKRKLSAKGDKINRLINQLIHQSINPPSANGMEPNRIELNLPHRPRARIGNLISRSTSRLPSGRARRPSVRASFRSRSPSPRSIRRSRCAERSSGREGGHNCCRISRNRKSCCPATRGRVRRPSGAPGSGPGSRRP
jgi:hypothetical protein